MADTKSFVALNIGSQRVSMAVFSATSGGGLLLQKYESTELLADPAADASRIAQLTLAVNELTEKLRVRKQLVRYAISGQSVFSRFVKLPPLTAEKVDQIVEFEAHQNVPFPINEVVWDFQLVASGASGEVEVVLVAIKSDSLNELNEAVIGASLRTGTVDMAPMALYNAFRYNYSELSQSCLLIDIGARTTNLIYIEGSRVFTRSIPVGGTTVTTAISKEFGISFLEAEARKVNEGFVALGGAYADHDDPEIAAMSKVIRNTLTRLHAEIVRTNNFYRTQQGGEAPEVVFLCGAPVSMPYIRDFFTEKLGLQVEFFNPLRNVLASADSDTERLSKEAHMLGELVGLGLRGLSSCPMELDLVPEAVQRAREVAERKPALLMAAVSILGLVGAAGFFFDRGRILTEEQTRANEAESIALETYDKQIQQWQDRQAGVDAKNEPFTDAIIGRIFWVSLLSDVNSKMNSDLVWLTSLEPYSNEQAVTKGLFGDSSSVSNNKKKNSPGQEAGEGMIDEIRVTGLYRENGAGGQVVIDFVERLKESDYFDIADLDTNEILKVDMGIPGQRWAWTFDLRLPFRESYHIPFKK